jgi:nitroreductase
MNARTAPSRPIDRVRPLIRTRQVREFTDEPVDEADLEALTEVARWTGSSRNQQPWRFIVLRDRDTIATIAGLGLPETRALRTAVAAIAIVLPEEQGRAVSHAYDEGRAAERILVAASLLGLGAGIAWIRTDVRVAAREILALPKDRFVRTVVALGHPSEAAKRPKSAKGQARLPRDDVVFEERWPTR